MLVRTALPFLTLLLAACSNYEFARARHADGSYDLPKLIADLKASGEERLSEGSWFPLVHFDATTFAASDPQYPAGYTLTESTGFGPLFSAFDTKKTIVDGQGAVIERDRVLGLLLGFLYYDHDQHVETPSGRREEERRRFLLVFGRDDVLYRRPAP